MAKGIVIVKYQGSGGTLRVTDSTSSVSDSASCKIGDTISFSQIYNGNVNDTVSFTIGDDAKASQLVKINASSINPGS